MTDDFRDRIREKDPNELVELANFLHKNANEAVEADRATGRASSPMDAFAREKRSKAGTVEDVLLERDEEEALMDIDPLTGK